jgi:hypothetical protein
MTTSMNVEAGLARLGQRLADLEAVNRNLARAQDIHDIQKVMALHEYYHAAFAQEEELKAIWSQESADVSFEESLFASRLVAMEPIPAMARMPAVPSGAGKCLQDL